MQLSKHYYKKPSKKPCNRCGVNRATMTFWLATPYNNRDKNSKESLSTAWKGTRYRSAYMSTIYVCKDCFVEIGNDLAKLFLDVMDNPNFKTSKVQNIQYMKEMAEFRHERAIVKKVEKAQKFEVRQTKHKESNNGLDVVSAAL